MILAQKLSYKSILQDISLIRVSPIYCEKECLMRQSHNTFLS